MFSGLLWAYVLSGYTLETTVKGSKEEYGGGLRMFPISVSATSPLSGKAQSQQLG